MPRKSIKKSQPKDFESKRRNPISLGDDSNLDNDFKSLKIGDTPTGLEFKLGEIRSTADNFVTHKETTEELFVTRIKGNRAGDLYSPQILMQSPDPLANNYGLNINIFATGSTFLNATGSNASLYLESDGLQLYYIGDSSDNAFAWYYGSLGGSGTKLMQLDYEGELSLFSTADEGDYFKIAIGSAGATTISTTDNGGAVGHLTLDVDGDIELNADGGTVEIKDGTASHFLFDCDGTRFRIYDDTNANDFFSIIVGDEGATNIRTADADTTVGHITLQPDGDLILDPVTQKTIINATDELYFDGGTHTKIAETSDDVLKIIVGGDDMIEINEGTNTTAMQGMVTTTHGVSVPTGRMFHLDTPSGHTYFAEVEDDGVGFTIGGQSILFLKELATTSVLQSSYVKTFCPLQLADVGDADTPASTFGSLYVNSDVLYFKNDSGTATNLLAGGTSTWHQMIGGYTTNKTSTTTYYTFYRFWYENWTNGDSSPTSISSTDSYASFFIAPRAGTITNVKVSGYASDTGATDPFKFYFYKASMVSDASSVSLSALFNTSAITPPTSGRTFIHTEDFSSSNTFAEDDMLYVWWKKDSNTGSQDVYWNINISGEYD